VQNYNNQISPQNASVVMNLPTTVVAGGIMNATIFNAIQNFTQNKLIMQARDQHDNLIGSFLPNIYSSLFGCSEIINSIAVLHSDTQFQSAINFQWQVPSVKEKLSVKFV
jgi:hypothetical protein